MINNITEDRCSFEVAKLLKEKGFAVYCTSLYTEDGKQNDVGNYNGVDDDDYISYSRPTHALAIKWVRENFNIWISVDWTLLNNEDEVPIKVNWWYMISGEIGNPEKSIDSTESESYSSPEEATEAALLYALQNLIK